MNMSSAIEDAALDPLDPPKGSNDQQCADDNLTGSQVAAVKEPKEEIGLQSRTSRGDADEACLQP